MYCLQNIKSRVYRFKKAKDRVFEYGSKNYTQLIFKYYLLLLCVSGNH